ncbi:MAG: L-serine ammonia-lyase, iron-sulfur-dependent, subunit alpha [bacterium]
MKRNDYPSIFNDVTGPVMRGPSSSHCAGALRIGRMIRDLMQGSIRDARIVYDPNGSLVTTHESQGSDMGLYSGFLGYDADDERLLAYKEGLKQSGIRVEVCYESIGATHPNTYHIEVKNELTAHTVKAISTGGGMIEIIEIDGAEVSMKGDYVETLFFLHHSSDPLVEKIQTMLEGESVLMKKGENPFLHISTSREIPSSIIAEITQLTHAASIVVIQPVLPVLARKGMTVPFSTSEEMLKFNEGKNLALWELAVAYEAERGNFTGEYVIDKMREIVQLLRRSLDSGLKGTDYADRILPVQSLRFKTKMEENRLVEGSVLNRIILYVTAMLEVKSSMGIIVAAPTAGSCGTLPGALLGTGDALHLDDDEIVKAMLAAGVIGVFIAERSTFAAESAGCQAECGSAAGMAAAGLVHLAGGTLQQSLSAASFALQNSFGMTCDPIANRVEAPCLGKNVMAAVNALACANMALADYQHLIPLDEVLQAFDAVGRSLPYTLRCTGLGGLSITPSAKRIEGQLQRKAKGDSETSS